VSYNSCTGSFILSKKYRNTGPDKKGANFFCKNEGCVWLMRGARAGSDLRMGTRCGSGTCDVWFIVRTAVRLLEYFL
jgi:hypothetical protein